MLPVVVLQPLITDGDGLMFEQRISLRKILQNIKSSPFYTFYAKNKKKKKIHISEYKIVHKYTSITIIVHICMVRASTSVNV